MRKNGSNSSRYILCFIPRTSWEYYHLRERKPGIKPLISPRINSIYPYLTIIKIDLLFVGIQFSP